MKKFLLTPTVVATLVAASFLPNAHAILIGFDAAEGYTPGALSGKPDAGTQWSGSGAWLAVTAEGGNQVAQSPAADPANFINNVFQPTAADLGGTNAASGLYDYSFDLRSDSTPADQDFTTAAIIRIGGTSSQPALRLNISSNGRIQYFDGGTATNVVTASATNFDLDDVTGTFVTIFGTIDFDNSQYSLTVNGVSQGTALAFNTTGQANFGAFEISAGNSTTTSYRQTSFDNVSLAAVPEPSTTAALLVGGIALVIFARRRRVA